MRAFAYASAASVDEVLGRLEDDGAVRPLAGGTDLLTLMKAGLFAPDRLVDIKRSGLPRGVEYTADGVTLGALTTLADVEASPMLVERYRALVEAAAQAATPQLRNMATVAGNLLQRPRCWYFRHRHLACWLKGGEDCPARDGENQTHAIFGGGPCHAAHPSDLAPALMVLDASVVLRGSEGERTIPIDELFALPTEARRVETRIDDGELILAIHLPAAVTRGRSTFLKAMDRRLWAFALVGVAAWLAVDDGRIAAARLALSGVAPIPWRAREAERVLVGAPVGASTLDRAAAVAVEGAAALSRNAYKIPLARVLVRRALGTLTEVD